MPHTYWFDIVLDIILMYFWEKQESQKKPTFWFVWFSILFVFACFFLCISEIICCLNVCILLYIKNPFDNYQGYMRYK